MSRAITVTFDKTEKDIPCLCVTRQVFSLCGNEIYVDKFITGEKAERLWDELTKSKADRCEVK